MTPDKAVWILLDAMEESGLKLAEAADEVRRMLKTGDETLGETVTKRLEKFTTGHSSHPMSPPHSKKRRYTRPIPDQHFPNYFELNHMPDPTDREAVVGMAYDDRGRTILSELHQPIDWVESDLQNLVTRMNQGQDITKVVVFGTCKFTPSQGSVGKLASSKEMIPVVFTGFDQDSVIDGFFVLETLANVFFEDLTIHNFHVPQCHRVVFENCLIDGFIKIGHGPTDCIQTSFRFCEFTEDCDVVLRNPDSTVFEFCHFHKKDQVHLVGAPKNCSTIGQQFGEEQSVLRQA